MTRWNRWEWHCPSQVLILTGVTKVRDPRYEDSASYPLFS
jgi:hypothetical protein